MSILDTLEHKVLPADRKRLRSSILAIYAYSLFGSFIIIYPLYAVMFADFGLNALQISVLFTTWSITGFLLEVPSGALADKYSRKYILFYAQIFWLFGYASWTFFPTFWGFLTGFVLWGTHGAFTSGTFQALVYDELKHFGIEDEYAKVIGRVRVLETVGFLFANLAAAVLIQYGYRVIMIASLAAIFVSAIPILFIRPAAKVESTGEVRYFAILKSGLVESIHNRVVLRLIIFASFALVFGGALEEYWPLFFTEAGIPKPGIGLLWAAIAALQAFAGLIAHRFKHYPDRSIYAAYFASGAFVFIGAYFLRPISVVSIIMFGFLWMLIDIIIETKLQNAIAVGARATVLSVRGLLSEVAAIVLFAIFGLTGDRLGYRGGFLISSLIIMLIGMLYLIISNHSQRSRN